MNKWLRASVILLACATMISLAFLFLPRPGIQSADTSQVLAEIPESYRATPQDVLAEMEIEGEPTVLLIGDSLAAGDGAGGYAKDGSNSAQACHQSTAGAMSLLISAERRSVVACSRATTADFHDASGQSLPVTGKAPSQMATVRREHPDAVILWIGANDIGFPQLLNDCLVRESFDCSADQSIRNGTAELMESIQPKLEHLYARLIAATPAKVIIPAYPNLLDGSGRCGRINAAEREFGHEVITELNNRISAAVRSVGAEQHAEERIVFVDQTARVLAGHGPCSDDSWVNPYGAVSLLDAATSRSRGQEILHPTATGYAALTRALAPHLDF